MRRNPVFAGVLALACACASGACTSVSSPTVSVDPGGDPSGDASGAKDVPVWFPDTAEAGGDPAGDPAGDPLDDPLPGDEGDGGDVPPALQPCDEPGECPSGFCVLAPDAGKVCAPPCLEAECPPGWTCSAVRGTGGDTIFVCLPSADYLCRPCKVADDCGPPGAKTQDRCVEYGPAGRFCGRDCSADGACPQGYVCKDLGEPGRGDAEDAVFQCVLEQGLCSCTEEFSAAGYETVCYVENDAGRCEGVRACGPEGLAPCSAATPAPEVCNGQDEDCDGQTDDGIAIHECEKTAGGHTCKGPLVCEGGKEVCKAAEPSDEKCNGIDDDCDGVTDPEGVQGCTKFYVDADDDSYGTDASWKCLCAAEPPYTAPVKGDCDDSDPAVNPGAPETCAGGKDDDCDGGTDEEGAAGCADWYRDMDADGFGGTADRKCLCAPAGDWATPVGGDCDDGNALVMPGAPETCDGRDEDCNGTIDDEDASGCSEYLPDADGDGYGIGDETRCFCGPTPPWTAQLGGDCDDALAGANPGVEEECDLIDDDCDGEVDEEGAGGCSAYYEDQDQDGWAPAGAEPHCLCAPAPPISAPQVGDCDDSWDAVNPAATEKCANLTDDDCDGQTDEEGGAECATFYRDDDGDGWGVTGDSKCYCTPEAPYTALKAGDCADAFADIHPGVAEGCDGVDNDCDALTDEEDSTGCITYLKDADGDLYGADGDAKCLCAPAGAYTTLLPGDCDDADPEASPAVAEKCDGKDNDCDAAADEEGAAGCVAFHRDADQDTYGQPGDSRCLCAAVPPHTAGRAEDCDDADPAVNPAAAEACNGHDDDCDAAVDEPDAAGCATYWRNADHDAYGATGDSRCLCAAAAPYDVQQPGDCNDADAETFPGATERCDGHDDDCDGAVDEEGAGGCVPYYWDGDGDAWGVDGQSRCLCGPDGKHSATKAGDCSDADATVNPGLPEKCGNQRDDNCDMKADDEGAQGCQPYFLDSDGDGWGTTATKCLCVPADPYDATKSGDCADGDGQVYPGRTEVCDNGKDDDCDGDQNDENASGCKTFWYDGDSDSFGQDGNTKCFCWASGSYSAGKGGDCADGDGQVYPGRKEVCNNGKDDNCDFEQNEKDASACALYYWDNDGDGWGTTQAECWCAPHDMFTASKTGDCDDWNGSVSPGATETCNWIDDNCRNGIDEAGASGCTTYYRDGDNDGWGSSSSQCLCTPADPFDVTNSNDCNDSDSSVWPGASEQCNQRDDNCNGSVDEGFECKVGQSEQQSCGTRCGKQTRSCTGSCAWGAWGSCGGEGVCTPGEQQTEACGMCGTRTRTCTSSCGWGTWSSCSGQGVCTAGSSQSQSCGWCGTQSRTCNSSCQWNTWGSCTGQGVCSAGSQRDCLDACGKQTCSSSCQWGSCSYTRDGYESNDTWATATSMGSYTEPNAPGARSAWLHTNGDVDRFWWRGTESGSLTDLSLAASVTLVSSSSLWHELCIYWDDGYNGSIEKQACKTGWGTITATVDGLDSWGSTQVGDIDVSVSGDWSCSSYTLQFTWN